MSEELKVSSIDELWDNLALQHAVKMEEYLVLKGQVDGVANNPTSQTSGTTFDLRDLQGKRDELVKIEGALDALNIIFTQIEGKEERTYVIEPERPAPKVRTKGKSGEKYKELEEWHPDYDAPKVNIGL
jgi:hypothetical protein